MATKGKSRGQNWNEHEIQALVSLWSEEGFQRELKKSVRNDLAYARISRELAERGYIRMAEQCRAKVKSGSPLSRQEQGPCPVSEHDLASVFQPLL